MFGGTEQNQTDIYMLYCYCVFFWPCKGVEEEEWLWRVATLGPRRRRTFVNLPVGHIPPLEGLLIDLGIPYHCCILCGEGSGWKGEDVREKKVRCVLLLKGPRGGKGARALFASRTAAIAELMNPVATVTINECLKASAISPSLRSQVAKRFSRSLYCFA